MTLSKTLGSSGIISVLLKKIRDCLIDQRTLKKHGKFDLVFGLLFKNSNNYISKKLKKIK